MDVLIAHGSAGSRRALVQALAGQGYEVVETCDGPKTLDALLEADSPRLAILDWDLPGIDGPEICRLVRRYRLAGPPYLVLLAAGRDRTQITAGLEAGANDCLRTPVSGTELRARVHAGRRFVELPWERADRLATAGKPTSATAVPAIDPAATPSAR
jgi:DNA-binding response OmpR family regulator